MTFKVNDKVKSIDPYENKRWRGIVVQVGVGQVKVRSVSDKKGKDVYWLCTDYLVVV
jgi:hypothetical protein